MPRNSRICWSDCPGNPGGKPDRGARCGRTSQRRCLWNDQRALREWITGRYLLIPAAAAIWLIFIRCI